MNKISIFTIFLIFSTYSYAFKEGVCKIVSVGGTQTVQYVDYLTGKPIEGREIEVNKLDKDGPYTYCSGSLLDKDHLLTAAHCFKGSIEQNKKRVSIPIRRKVKKRVNGKVKWIVPPYCNDPYWTQKRPCIAKYEAVEVTMNLGKVTAHCYGADGKFYQSELKTHNGWPNPMYSAKRTKARFDFAIWKLEKSLDHIKATPLETDPKVLKRLLERNGRNCKAYGFGLNPDKTSGKFRDLDIFIDGFNEIKIVSNRFNDVTAPGDSGGPLVCPDLQGQSQAVGLVSHGITSKGVIFQPDITQDVFTSLAYNKTWIDAVLKEPKRTKRSEKEYDDLAVNFEINYFKQELDFFKRCYKDSKHLFNKPTAPFTGKEFRNGIKIIEKQFKVIMKDYQKEDTYFTRGRLMIDLYDKSLTMRYNCSLVNPGYK